MIRFLQNGSELLARQHWAIQLAAIVGSAATVAVMTNALFMADAYAPPAAAETTAAQRQLLLRAPVAQWQGQTLKEGSVIRGDTGNDGKVNGIDLSTLASHYGESYPQADLNYNGTVDAGDRKILLDNWTW